MLSPLPFMCLELLGCLLQFLVPSFRTAKNYILFYCRVKVMLQLLFGSIKSEVALFLQTQSAPTFWEVHSDFFDKQYSRAITKISSCLLDICNEQMGNEIVSWDVFQFYFLFSIKVDGGNPQPPAPTPLVTALPF